MSNFDPTQPEGGPGACHQPDGRDSRSASGDSPLEMYRRTVEELLLARVRNALDASVRLAKLVEMQDLPVRDCFAASRALAECEAALKMLNDFCQRGGRPATSATLRPNNRWHQFRRRFRWRRWLGQ